MKSGRSGKKSRRRASIERLESRQFLAGDLNNVYMPYDVNNDMRVTSSDALGVINHLWQDNLRKSGGLVPLMESSGTFPDVNDDGDVTAMDALMIINRIHSGDSISVLGIETDSAPEGQTNRDSITNDLVILGRIGAPRVDVDFYSIRILQDGQQVGNLVPLDSSDSEGQFRIDLNLKLANAQVVEADLMIQLTVQRSTDDEVGSSVVAELEVRFDSRKPLIEATQWIGNQERQWSFRVSDASGLSDAENSPVWVDPISEDVLASVATLAFEGRSMTYQIDLPPQQFGPNGAEPIRGEAQGRTVWIGGSGSVEDIAGNAVDFPRSVILRRYDDLKDGLAHNAEESSLSVQAGKALFLSAERAHQLMFLRTESVSTFGERVIELFPTQRFHQVGLSEERFHVIPKDVVAASLVNDQGELIELIEVLPASDRRVDFFGIEKIRVSSEFNNLLFAVPVSPTVVTVVSEDTIGQVNIETRETHSVFGFPETVSLENGEEIRSLGSGVISSGVITGSSIPDHAILVDTQTIDPAEEYLLTLDHQWLRFRALTTGQLVAVIAVPERLRNSEVSGGMVYDIEFQQFASLTASGLELVFFDLVDGNETNRLFVGEVVPGHGTQSLYFEPLTNELRMAVNVSESWRFNRQSQRFEKHVDVVNYVLRSTYLSVFDEDIVVNRGLLAELLPEAFPKPFIEVIKTSSIAGEAANPDLPAVQPGGLVRIEGQNLSPEMPISSLHSAKQIQSTVEVRTSKLVYPIDWANDGTWLLYHIPEDSLAIDLNFEDYHRRFGQLVESSVPLDFQVVPLLSLSREEWTFNHRPFWVPRTHLGIDEAHYQLSHDNQVVLECGYSTSCTALTSIIGYSVDYFPTLPIHASTPFQSSSIVSQGGVDSFFLPLQPNVPLPPSEFAIGERTVDLATEYESTSNVEQSDWVSTGQEVSVIFEGYTPSSYDVVFENTGSSGTSSISVFPNSTLLFDPERSYRTKLDFTVPVGFAAGNVRIYQRSPDDRAPQIVFQKSLSVRPTVVASSGQSNLPGSSVVLAGTNLLNGQWTVDGIEVNVEDLSVGGFEMDVNDADAIDQQLGGMDLVRIRIPDSVSLGVIALDVGDLRAVFGPIHPWWDGLVPQPSVAIAFDTTLPVLSGGQELRIQSTGGDQKWYRFHPGNWPNQIDEPWVQPTIHDSEGRSSVQVFESKSIWFLRNEQSHRFGILFVAPRSLDVFLGPSQNSVTSRVFEYQDAGPTEFQWGETVWTSDYNSVDVVFSTPESQRHFPEFGDTTPNRISRQQIGYVNGKIAWGDATIITSPSEMPSGDLTVRNPWGELTRSVESRRVFENIRASSGFPKDPSLPSVNPDQYVDKQLLDASQQIIVPVRVLGDSSTGETDIHWKAVNSEPNLYLPSNVVTGMYRESLFTPAVFVQVVPTIQAWTGPSSLTFVVDGFDETSTIVIGSKEVAWVDGYKRRWQGMFSLLEPEFHDLTAEDLRAGVYITSRGGRSETLTIPFLESVVSTQTFAVCERSAKCILQWCLGWRVLTLQPKEPTRDKADFNHQRSFLATYDR